jgi:chemotaxis protein MotB
MRSRRAHEEPENHERWLVSYADFITLLFAFFTVLYATADRNIEKQKRFENSVRDSMRSFMTLGGGAGGGEFATLDNNASPVEPPFELYRRENESLIDFAQKILDQIRRSLTGPELSALNPDVMADDDGIRIVLSTDALFDQGTDKLNPKILQPLNKLLRTVPLEDREIQVEAHTSRAAGKNAGSPWAVTSSQAATIVRYILGTTKADPKRISLIAHADQVPASTGTTDEDATKNRRIEIVLKVAVTKSGRP